jgi:hypothetical protein
VLDTTGRELKDFGTGDGDIQLSGPNEAEKRGNSHSGIRRITIYGNVGMIAEK